MNRKKVPLTVLCVALVITAGIATVLLVFAPQPPTLSLQDLPAELDPDASFTGGQLVAGAGKPPYSFTCEEGARLAIAIDSKNRTVTWEKPVVGKHAIAFTVTDRDGGAARATWQVEVRPKPEDEEQNPVPPPPAIALDALPSVIQADTPFSAELGVTGKAPLTVSCDLPAVSLSGHEVTWGKPVAGQHSITFTATDPDNRSAAATWQVTVERAEAPPPTLSVDDLPATVKPGPYEGKVAAAGSAPFQFSCEPAGVLSIDPESGRLSATFPDEPREYDFTIKVKDATNREAACTWSVAIEATPAPKMPWEPVPKFPNEVHVQLDGRKKLYGQGSPDAKRPPDGYLINRLKRGGVTFVCDVAEHAQTADAEMDALLDVGAELLADTTPPTITKTNAAGHRILAARGAEALSLPLELWWTLFRTSDSVKHINTGSVKWQIRPYAPDPNGYAVVIREQDIEKR